MFKKNRSTANQNLAVFRINYFNEKQTICHKRNSGWITRDFTMACEEKRAMITQECILLPWQEDSWKTFPDKCLVLKQVINDLAVWITTKFVVLKSRGAICLLYYYQLINKVLPLSVIYLVGTLTYSHQSNFYLSVKHFTDNIVNLPYIYD